MLPMQELIRERLRLIEDERRRLEILRQNELTPEEISEFQARVVALTRGIEDLDGRLGADAGEPLRAAVRGAARSTR